MTKQVVVVKASWHLTRKFRWVIASHWQAGQKATIKCLFGAPSRKRWKVGISSIMHINAIT